MIPGTKRVARVEANTAADRIELSARPRALRRCGGFAGPPALLEAVTLWVVLGGTTLAAIVYGCIA